MLSPDNESGRGPARGGDAGALPEMLVRRLTSSFGIPADEAREIVRDSQLALRLAVDVPDPDMWLVGTVCRVARGYWRRDLPADATRTEARLAQEAVITGAALETLAPRFREALRLRLHDGRSYRQIAYELDVSEVYARHMVAHALVKIVRALRK